MVFTKVRGMLSMLGRAFVAFVLIVCMLAQRPCLLGAVVGDQVKKALMCIATQNLLRLSLTGHLTILFQHQISRSKLTVVLWRCTECWSLRAVADGKFSFLRFNLWFLSRRNIV
jgi:hypothetical protein